MAINNMFGTAVPFFAMQTKKEKDVKTPKQLKALKKVVAGIIEEADKAGAPASVVNFLKDIDLDQTYFDLRKEFKKNGVCAKSVLKALGKNHQIGWLIGMGKMFARDEMEASIDAKIATMPPEKMEELKKFFDL